MRQRPKHRTRTTGTTMTSCPRTYFLLCCLVTAPDSFGDKRSYEVFSLAGPVIIDGRLDDEAWRRIPAVTGFYKHTTDRYCLAKQTLVKAAYDSGSYYVAFHCYEPDLAKVRGSKQDHSSIWQEDCVEVFVLSPQAKAFSQFLVNTEGARWNFVKSLEDGSLSPERTLARWQGAALSGPDFWSAELRIPFDLLGQVPSDGAVWTGNFCRDITVSDSGGDALSTWARLRMRFQEPQSFGSLVFRAQRLTTEQARSREQELNAKYRGRLIDWFADTSPRIPALRKKLDPVLEDATHRAKADLLLAAMTAIETVNPSRATLDDLVRISGKAFRLEIRINDLVAGVLFERLFE